MIQRHAQFQFFIKRSGTSFFIKFCVWFFKENVSHFASINWPNFIAWLPLLLEILGNTCIVIICFPVCDVINFEFNLNFPLKLFPTWSKKLEQNLNTFRTKRAFTFRWNKKHFSSFLEDYYLPEFDLDLKVCL